MAIQCKIANISYSISKMVVTINLTLQTFDDTIVDDTGTPKILDEKNISVQQNMLDPNALNNLTTKILNEVNDYLNRCKTNFDRLATVFGTLDSDVILENLKTNLQLEIDNAVSTIFSA